MNKANDFYGSIDIPKEVMAVGGLSPLQKAMVALILATTDKEGSKEPNEFFASRLDVAEEHINTIINGLVEMGAIRAAIDNDGRVLHVNDFLFKSDAEYQQERLP